MAVQCPAQHDIPVVTGQRPIHLDCRAFARAGESPHAVCFVVLRMQNAAVRGQIGQRGGGAVLVQVAGGRAQEATVGHDASGAQAAVGQFAETDRQVEPAFHQVDRPVRDFQLDLDVGIALGKVRDQRGDGGAAESQGGVHFQRAARCAAAAGDRVFHRAQVIKDLRRVRQVGLAFGSQAEIARAAVDQPHAQPPFHQRQALGGGGGRQVEFACGRRKAAQTGQMDEKLQFGRDVGFH